MKYKELKLFNHQGLDPLYRSLRQGRWRQAVYQHKHFQILNKKIICYVYKKGPMNYSETYSKLKFLEQYKNKILNCLGFI